MKTSLRKPYILPALIAWLGLILAAQATAQPYTFGPEFQSTKTASITYNSGTGTFQYTDTANPSLDDAAIFLAGTAADFIATSNGWIASLTINLSGRSMTATSAESSQNGMGLGIVYKNGANPYTVHFSLGQANNTGGAKFDWPNGLYGTAAEFSAETNSNYMDTTTPLGNSGSFNGISLLVLSGGTNASATNETISAATGVLTLSYNGSTETLTGYYNEMPVASYSIASWGSNPPLNLYVFGSSGSGISTPARTDTASNFYCSLANLGSAPLQVQTTGLGSLSPNYSNAWLAINQSYSMTAKPDKGFGFVDWTDGLGNVITNGATLKFIMASNLTFVANFVDITKPTLSITNPIKSGEKWSNSVFTVSGKAGDNVAVSNVWVSLNSGSWTSATLLNHGSNWTEQVTLIPGTNTLAAYAVDTSGSFSLTNTVKLDYILSAPLTVQIVGEGKLTPNYNGQLLAVGSSYTMKAAGTNGFAFYYWSGGVPMSANSTLTFTMASNLTIIANFKDVTPPVKPTITFPTANQKWSNSVITVTGKASDNVGVAKVWVQINDGGWTAGETANGFTNWSAANLRILFGTNILQACAVDAAGNVSTTNEVKFIGVVAPMSLAGYAATAKPSGGKPTIAMTWGDSTWAQTGTGDDTNANDYCAGSYTYIQTGSNSALLTNVDIGMMSALGTTNVTTVELRFTSATTANYAWSSEHDSGSGTMTFSQVSNLVPATLAGKTVQFNVNNVAGVVKHYGSDGTFTSIEANGSTHYGTYTFTQYSPIVAIIQGNYTDPDEAGAVEYAELTFTSANAGRVYGCYYGNPTYGSNPDEVGGGGVATFELK